MTIKDTLRHLFPKSFQWNLTYGRHFLDLVNGITPSIDAARANVDEVFEDLIPATASLHALGVWERQWALPTASSLTEQERRDRLAATWAALGGQSPTYIQDTLQQNGFDIFVHEWWESTDPPNPPRRDPRDHLKAEFGGTDADGFLLVNTIHTSTKGGEIGMGEAFAEMGEPDAAMGHFSGYTISSVPYGYVGPEPMHAYYLYLGDAVFPDTVDIPVERRVEFENLCRKICPAQQWLVLRVRYV